MNYTVTARVAMLTSANYNAKNGIYVPLNDNNMVWVMPFKSYRDFRAWYLRADDSSKIFHQIWFGPGYTYNSMSDVATRLAKEFDQLNDMNYYRLVNKDSNLDLAHPIELDYMWTPDHVVKIKASWHERNKKNLVCHSLL